jgi:hypothetical protein
MLQEYRELPLVQSVKALPIPVSILLYDFLNYYLKILKFLYKNIAGSPEHFGAKEERTGIPKVSCNKEYLKWNMLNIVLHDEVYACESIQFKRQYI